MDGMGELQLRPRFHTGGRQVKCPVPCSEVTLTSGAEVGDLSTKVRGVVVVGNGGRSVGNDH